MAASEKRSSARVAPRSVTRDVATSAMTSAIVVALDSTAAPAIVGVAAQRGDAALFDALLAASRRASSPDEYYRYLFATTSFRDPALIQRALEYGLSPDLRNQDTALYFARLLFNDGARVRTWAFLKEHWTALAPQISVAGGDTNLVSSLAAFCDAGARDDVKAFFAAHPLPVATRTLSQTLERIDACVALREKQLPFASEWLAGR